MVLVKMFEHSEILERNDVESVRAHQARLGYHEVGGIYGFSKMEEWDPYWIRLADEFADADQNPLVTRKKSWWKRMRLWVKRALAFGPN